MSIRGGTEMLNSGYPMPRFGLGLHQIRGPMIVKCVLETALQAGYRLFDSAGYYGNEKDMGDAFLELLPGFGLTRDEIFVSTKVRLSTDDSRHYVRQQIEESLRALRFDYLDLVIISYPRPDGVGSGGSDSDPRNKDYRCEAYEELIRLQGEGKIRSVGVANFEISHLKQLENGLSLLQPAVNQLQFHPQMQRCELRAYCEQVGIVVQAFASLGHNDPRLIKDQKLQSVAKHRRVSVQQILLAYGLHHNVAVIPKSTTPSRVMDNIDAVKVRLTTEDVAVLDSMENGNSYSPTEGWNVL